MQNFVFTCLPHTDFFPEHKKYIYLFSILYGELQGNHPRKFDSTDFSQWGHAKVRKERECSVKVAGKYQRRPYLKPVVNRQPGYHRGSS